MRPEDLALVQLPGVPALHGDLLLTALSTPDPVTDRYTGSIWRIATEGTGRTRWTWGEHDTCPVISPDGSRVAFLRTVDGGKPQLYVMPASGGEPRRLTDAPLGVTEPVFAPDSRRIAYLARIPEPDRYNDAVQPQAEAGRLITRLDYRADDVGFVVDRRRRLFVVDAESQDAPVELTDGRCEVRQPAWTPDGTHILMSTPRDFGVRETEHSDICAIPAAGGEPILLAHCPGTNSALTVTEDGTILFVSDEYQRYQDEPCNDGLWALPLNLTERGTPRRLTDTETVDVEATGRTPVVHEGRVLITVSHRGTVPLVAVPLDAEMVPLADLPVLAGADGVVNAFAAQGGRIAAVVSTVDNPGEVVLLDGAEATTVTDVGAELRGSGLCRLVEIDTTAPDGYPVHGFVVLPDGPGPHPVLLHVHGGPFAQHVRGFFDEAQVYASAGYAVVLGNPRGSAGYGQAHGKAVVKAMGTVDVSDLLALLDAALLRPDCDETRVGVMGGSYGGFMTGWLASHHPDRFVAAWSERAVNSWESLYGTSDIGYYFTEMYLGTDVETLRASSPLTYAEQITMPFMIVHSEQDWRCPLEQAQRMYVALKANGTPTQFLLFPGEGHELSRSGRPRHRIQRLNAVLDWWTKWLPA
ncbi:MAG TPA: S9 family peptidase [Pseudonocardiaceae bacterium]|nr:S9 family peptidase [Pseudonocardiaceae bacterium]